MGNKKTWQEVAKTGIFSDKPKKKAIKNKFLIISGYPQLKQGKAIILIGLIRVNM